MTAPAPRILSVHTRDGVIVVPLTGDTRLDAALLRMARRGGCVVTTSEGEVLAPGGDPDAQFERAAIAAEGNA